MLSQRSRFIKRRGLESLPNIPNIVRCPLDLAALINLLRLYTYSPWRDELIDVSLVQIAHREHSYFGAIMESNGYAALNVV